jgi:hypothetical protein
MLIEKNNNFREETNFITDTERQELKDIVLSMQDDWTPIYPAEGNFGASAIVVKGLLEKLANAGIGFYHLGDAAYTLKCGRKRVSEIDFKVRDKLVEKAGWIFKRVCDKVTEITGVPSQLFNPRDFTSPGFHVSTVPFDIPGAAELHQDFSVVRYMDNVDEDSITSLIVLIEEPTVGAFLEWEDPNSRKLSHYYYKYGSLHMFRGSLFHRVGSYETKLGEHRITLQCHMYYDKKLKRNFIYF